MTAIRAAIGVRRVLQALGPIALVAATAAAAQDVASKPAEAGAEAQDGDVVVTARRTRELLQTVPMSISALSADQLAQAGVNTFADTVA